MSFCKNCGTEVDGKFCSNCGTKIEEIDLNSFDIKKCVSEIIALKKDVELLKSKYETLQKKVERGLSFDNNDDDDDDDFGSLKDDLFSDAKDALKELGGFFKRK